MLLLLLAPTVYIRQQRDAGVLISSASLALPAADDCRLTRFHDILDFKQLPARGYFMKRKDWFIWEERGRTRRKVEKHGGATYYPAPDARKMDTPRGRRVDNMLKTRHDF